MLDVAIRKSDGSSAVDWQHVGIRTAPPLPVSPALAPLLPGGLRRGSTVSVGGSLSLLLALLGAASADGAWCALVGFPRISAEAAGEYGIDLTRLALVPTPSGGWAGTGWTTVVGALLDAVDIVAARPPRGRAAWACRPADVRRLAARARSKDAVLVPYLAEQLARGRRPAAGPRGRVVGHRRRHGTAAGPAGRGHASGRGQSARPRSASLWLPADGGGAVPDVAGTAPLAPVIELAG